MKKVNECAICGKRSRPTAKMVRTYGVRLEGHTLVQATTCGACDKRGQR